MTFIDNNNKEKNKIATRLKIARMIRGYRSRAAFAEKFNLKLSTYNAHETGRHEIGASYVSKYCLALNVSANWLILGVGTPFDLKAKHKNKTEIINCFRQLIYLSETGKILTS